MLVVWLRRRIQPVTAVCKQHRSTALGRDMEMVNKKRILLLDSQGLSSEVAATVLAYNQHDRRLS
jgi:hypothetical protein